MSVFTTQQKKSIKSLPLKITLPPKKLYKKPSWLTQKPTSFEPSGYIKGGMFGKSNYNRIVLLDKNGHVKSLLKTASGGLKSYSPNEFWGLHINNKQPSWSKKINVPFDYGKCVMMMLNLQKKFPALKDNQKPEWLAKETKMLPPWNNQTETIKKQVTKWMGEDYVEDVWIHNKLTYSSYYIQLFKKVGKKIEMVNKIDSIQIVLGTKHPRVVWEESKDEKDINAEEESDRWYIMYVKELEEKNDEEKNKFFMVTKHMDHQNKIVDNTSKIEYIDNNFFVKDNVVELLLDESEFKNTYKPQKKENTKVQKKENKKVQKKKKEPPAPSVKVSPPKAKEEEKKERPQDYANSNYIFICYVPLIYCNNDGNWRIKKSKLKVHIEPKKVDDKYFATNDTDLDSLSDTSRLEPCDSGGCVMNSTQGSGGKKDFAKLFDRSIVWPKGKPFPSFINESNANKPDAFTKELPDGLKFDDMNDEELRKFLKDETNINWVKFQKISVAGNAEKKCPIVNKEKNLWYILGRIPFSWVIEIAPKKNIEEHWKAKDDTVKKLEGCT